MMPDIHRFAVSAALLALSLGSLSMAVAEDAHSLPVGQRQLFLDDDFVAKIENLKRTLHQPEKRGAVIRSANPSQTIQTRTAPVWDPEANHFKLWVMSTDEPLRISTDGLHWTAGRKPNLRIDHAVYDPHDKDPARRFKAALLNEGFAVSPDGVQWTKLDLPAIPSSDEGNFSYDPREGLFIHSVNGPVGHPSDGGMKRIADAQFVAIAKKADVVELSEAHIAAVNRRRRIYVNNDVGYDAVAMGPKLTAIKPEEWIAARFSAFDQPGSQVDCVGWCLDEGNIAAFPSKIVPELQYPTLLRWREGGVDIAQRIVEESHRRKREVFWEHRLNGADREADVTTPARHPLKDQHPEWLIAGSWWKPGLWNFAIPEVRQYKIAALREVAERYDLDGINLDFGRHPPFLPTGQQWEHREALTDFVRQVRTMLQGVAERRGRPFLLAVRVADTVPGCHFDGMDVETWVRHHLVDMIIIGTRSIQVDLCGFKRITTGSHVKLYPCIDQHHSPDGYHAVPSPEFLRGVAANWWHQGADGIATFNFWNELPASAKVIGTSGPMFNGQSVHALAYTELGDPGQLASLDKWFVVSRRYGGGFYDRLGNRWDDYTNLNHQAPLPLKLGADPAWVEVSLADDIAARANQIDRLELRLQFSAETAPEKIAVKFNGIKLRPQKQEGNWWVFALTPQQTAQGRNVLTLDTVKPSEREQAISLEKAEVHVTYRSARHGK